MTWSTRRAAARSAQGGSLFDVLAANPTVSGALPTERLRALCDPANYLGVAPAMVDAIIGQRRGS